VALEVLYRPFVSFSGLPAGECAKVAAFAGFGILAAGIKAEFAGLKFPNHRQLLLISWMPPTRASKH
jgi:hypothetical protein